MTVNYPWYHTKTSTTLEQGDLFISCPVMEPTVSFVGDEKAISEIQGTIQKYDLIVLSQSCDLVNGKLQSVLVCPHWSIEAFENIAPYFRDSGAKEELRRGNTPGYHMLATCPLAGFESTIRIVNFRQVLSLPYTYLEHRVQTKEPRVSLLSPYREHLAQAFARFIMRVGLPVDIPPFKSKSK